MAIESAPEGHEYTLEQFQDEMRTWQADELSGKRKSGHLIGQDRDPNLFHPEELTLEDMEVWAKYKDKTLTREDLQEYKDSIDPRDVEPLTSRKMFRALLSNSIIFLHLLPSREQS